MSVGNQYALLVKCHKCGVLLRHYPRQGWTAEYRSPVPHHQIVMEAIDRLHRNQAEMSKVHVDEMVKLVSAEIRLGTLSPP